MKETQEQIEKILHDRKINFIQITVRIDAPIAVIVLPYDISEDLKKQISDEIFALCGVSVRYYIPSTLD